MWIIASIPFWLIGAIFMYCAAIVVPKRKPDETPGQLGVQLLVALTFAGISFVIAAKVAGAS